MVVCPALALLGAELAMALLVAASFGGVEEARPSRLRFVRRSRSALLEVTVLDRGAEDGEYLSAMESEPGVRIMAGEEAEPAVAVELRSEGGV